MLNKERVQAEIAQIEMQYSEGLCSKIEALEAMRDAVNCEINNHMIEQNEYPVIYPTDASDYHKAEILLINLKFIEKFKKSISFGDILQHILL
jgi:hypothetical protein